MGLWIVIFMPMLGIYVMLYVYVLMSFRVFRPKWMDLESWENGGWV